MVSSVVASMRGIFGKTLVVFALLAGLGFLVGCFNTIGTGSAERGPAPNGGTGTESGGGGGAGGPLSVSESLNLSIDENGPATTVILPYTSSTVVVPHSCEIQSLSNITEASPCTCVSGACSLGIQGETDVYGQGSFLFRLTGDGVSSNLGKAEVKIRQVTISPSLSFEQNQKAIVGETIKSPLVILVQNSENTSVRGVRVSWKTLEGSGGISSCTGTSDSKGLAQCNWTLGKKSGSQGVEAAIFSGQSKARFSVSAVGGTAPNGPQPFTITSATPGNTKVDLVWGNSVGATSYTVKYGTSSGSYTPFATGVAGTSATVTGLTNGTTYYFMVTAVSASGSQDASAEFVGTPTATTTPGNPAEAAALWATRRIVPNYTGYAMRVRHGTNKAIAEVSFDSAGKVSASSIVKIISSGSSGWLTGQAMPFSTFYSGATVHVDTWYDQSGNGNHATQVVEGVQPVIVKGGTLGKGIEFTGQENGMAHGDDLDGDTYFNVSYTSSLDLHFKHSVVAIVEELGNQAFIFSQNWDARGRTNIILKGGKGATGAEFAFGVGEENRNRASLASLGVSQRYVIHGSYNGSRHSLSVNGAQTTKETEALQERTTKYFIGRDWYSPYLHSIGMKLSELAIYTKILD